MRPRIAYVINSLEGGGAALPIADLARTMQDWGADVQVMALLRRDGRALASIRAANLPCVVRAGTETDQVAALRWLDREIADWRPSLIWTSLSRATLLGQTVGVWRGIPVVSWQHNAFLKPWNLRLLTLMQRRSKLWIADSQSVADLTVQRMGVSADRVMTWPIFRADPEAPVATSWQPGQTIRLGSLGRLHAAKGYDVLIAALARLQANGFKSPVPFEVHVAGSGEELQKLRSEAADAKVDTMRWEGYVDNPKRFLASLHGYLQPSRREGFCIAAHEAMQAGLPVVASAVGELSYTVAEGISGFLTPPCHSEALAGALATLLNQPDRMHQMGKAARNFILTTFSAGQFNRAGMAILDRLKPIMSGGHTLGPRSKLPGIALHPGG